VTLPATCVLSTKRLYAHTAHAEELVAATARNALQSPLDIMHTSAMLSVFPERAPSNSCVERTFLLEQL